MGERIRQARLRAGMTQEQLARSAKTSTRNIVRWETESNTPRMEALVAIAAATGVTLADLLPQAGRDDDEEAAAKDELFAAMENVVHKLVLRERRLAKRVPAA